MRRQIPCVLTALAALMAMAAPAAAYVGPGAGISLLGALWGLVVAIAMAVGFVLFWPVRKMLRRKKARTGGPSAQTAEGEAPRTSGTGPS
ncbi:hypothetical protein HW532_03440 [Kaustia mangrovi]|uniref:Uncharacterized protein n=1 Tax=Kaustia mangrovi TaxID=2593653 RepID=A0A7S8C1X4_9HYPH|nr:hypothetical protein [Kaustia mangrovi]QPC41852.1 hypothetical protein HW532_03440 [Kaustia mangrovi]